MTPVTLLCVIILCATVLLAPRRWALLAVIAALVYLSQKHGVDVFGLRMHPARFLEIAGFIRVVSKQEFEWSQLNRLDRAVIVAYAYMATVFLLRSALGYGTSADIKMVSPLAKFGEFIDVLLIYITFRGLMRDEQDLKWMLQRSVMLLIPFVGAVLMERWTGQNPLAIFGAIQAVWFDADGDRIRCYGSFSHPSLLGTFGASFAIMYGGLAMATTRQVLGWVGTLLCIVIVVLSGSGGPVTMLMVGLLGWLCWPIRKKMKSLRIGIVAALVSLAIVMRDPIWYLPSKISAVTGGGGWHRSYLMNQAMTHLDQWWLAGMPLDLTLSWFPYLILGAADITNLYVGFGIDAGLIAVLLFIRVLVRAFGDVGRASQEFRKAVPPRRDEEVLAWGLGAAVAGHMANFFGITYFDQTLSLWLFQLAAISSISMMHRSDPHASTFHGKSRLCRAELRSEQRSGDRQ
jgi:hypothetical protein